MIVISSPIDIQDEIKIIHKLFEAGLDNFHLRKPNFSLVETQSFIEKIGLEFRSKIILHQHFELRNSYAIKQIHWSAYNRQKKDINDFTDCLLSTSTHTIEEFNELDQTFVYAFLSPIFSSISKLNYKVETNWKEVLLNRKNHQTQLIALGGISAEKITEIKQIGFDSFALLGTIWNSKNPIENFKLCQQNALLY